MKILFVVRVCMNVFAMFKYWCCVYVFIWAAKLMLTITLWHELFGVIHDVKWDVTAIKGTSSWSRPIDHIHFQLLCQNTLVPLNGSQTGLLPLSLLRAVVQTRKWFASAVSGPYWPRRCQLLPDRWMKMQQVFVAVGSAQKTCAVSKTFSAKKCGV